MVEARKVGAVAKFERDRVGDGWEGHALLPAFEGEEDKIFVLANGSADSAAELVLIALAAACGHDVVLPRVGVEDGVPPKIEQRTVPAVRSRPDDRIDVPATGAARLRVIVVN